MKMWLGRGKGRKEKIKLKINGTLIAETDNSNLALLFAMCN
jgi:hypothetical protein